MASTTFSSGTPITSVWLNDVNSLVWTAFGGAATAAAAANALSLGTASTASFAGVRVGDGGATTPSYSFTSNSTSGLFLNGNSGVYTTVNGQAGTRTDINGNFVLSGSLYIGGSGTTLLNTLDTILVRDAAAILALRNGTIAQTFRVYNTLTDASNYERLSIKFNAGNAIITTEAAGTGSNSRTLLLSSSVSADLLLGIGGVSYWKVNVSGAHFNPLIDNVQDVGTSSQRPRTVYAGTSVIIAGQAYTANGAIAALTFIIDGGGSVPTTGVKGDLLIPFACTINSATLQADQSGSAVVDIWKKTYTTSSPPTVANTITASALPTLSTAQSSQDATLTGWTTAVAANDMLRFNLNSVTTCTRLTLTLKVTKT